MNPKEEYEEKIAARVIENLKKRQMDGFYCRTKQDALAKIEELCSSSRSVSFGGSETLRELGVLDLLREKKEWTLLDRDTAASAEEKQRIFHEALSCDSYLMSTNAITKSGELLNIDGNGNRLAALIYGPKQVIVVSGVNKIENNLDSAMLRVRNDAAPQNAMRLHLNTPCSKTGFCADCLSPDCICSQIVCTRRSAVPGRIKIVLVSGSFGY